MNSQNTTFLELGPKKARSIITADIQNSVMGKNPYIRTLAIQNRLGFRETFYRAKTGEILDLFAIVSPPYTNDQKLSNSDDYFTRTSRGLEARVPKKLSAAIEAIKILSKYFQFRTNIVVADVGLLLSQDYVKSVDIGTAIADSEGMYQKRVSELLDLNTISVTRLSKIIGSSISGIRDMDFVASEEDCRKLIYENAISPDTLVQNLGILIKAFGVTVAYYELEAYFQESKLLGDTFGRSIILNIEGTSVGNQLLTKGKGNLCMDRMDSGPNRIERKGGNLLIGGTVTL